MGKEYVDLDKLFEQYIRERFLGDKKAGSQIIREQLAKLYHEWSNTPIEELEGHTPQEYYGDIDSPETLIDFLKKSCENGRAPNSFLLDRICELSTCAPRLVEIIEENNNPDLTLTAIELLQIMGIRQPLETYISILKEGDTDEDLKETIVEALSENAEEVRETLLDHIEMLSDELKLIFAEILVSAKKDERTYDLLVDLFYKDTNVPQVAALFGKYGDERCVTILYKALDDCNYMEYIEIKNAIERLGGVVEDHRDFSDDIYYKIIKEGYKT